MSVVLLAEDDAAIADPLSRALNREGYEVRVVVDGHSAYESANGGGIDLLVLDLGLPGIDGLDVCRRLRTARRPFLAQLVSDFRPGDVRTLLGLLRRIPPVMAARARAKRRASA